MTVEAVKIITLCNDFTSFSLISSWERLLLLLSLTFLFLLTRLEIKESIINHTWEVRVVYNKSIPVKSKLPQVKAENDCSHDWSQSSLTPSTEACFLFDSQQVSTVFLLTVQIHDLKARRKVMTKRVSKKEKNVLLQNFPLPSRRLIFLSVGHTHLPFF